MKMYNVYFDSGTSNTRAYLLKDNHVVDVIKKNIGSKDSSIAGSNLVLIKGLKQLYDELLANNKLEDKEIKGVYASGMVTCPFGIEEVPHLSTPISLQKLYDGIYTHYEFQLFKRDIHLIRGAKTITDDFKVDKYNIPTVNNMRGEEIEIFGILSELPDKWRKGDIAIFLPGSHTHIAYVKQGVLHDILSTFSGELYHAISTGTILSSSIQCGIDELDEEMVLLGFRNLKEYGLNRAIYIAHAMKIFNVSNNLERKSYLEGVITGGVTLVFEKAIQEKWYAIDKVIVAGNNNIAKVYEITLKEIDQKVDVMTLVASGKQSFAVKGLLEILKKGAV
jgi:2-keto-3-deoxy-galactonokinase